MSLIFFADPDSAVAHEEVHEARIAALFHELHADDDLASLGELDRVADQVDEDLTQPVGIAPVAGAEVGRDLASHFEVLLAHGSGEQKRHLVDEPSELEVAILELRTPRLEFRKIENVVDDAQEAIRRLLDALGESLLLVIELCSE